MVSKGGSQQGNKTYKKMPHMLAFETGRVGQEISTFAAFSVYMCYIWIKLVRGTHKEGVISDSHTCSHIGTMGPSDNAREAVAVGGM